MNKTPIILILIISIYGCTSNPLDQETLYSGNMPIGTFKAVINNQTAFTNGPDIIDVNQDMESGVIEELCTFEKQEHICPFRLGIIITKEAAERIATITDSLDIIEDDGLDYLSQPLVLYLKGEKIDELRIAAELKGLPIQEMLISGGGSGKTKQQAINNAQQKHDELFTLLLDIPSEE